jgi:hypothetical protein
MNAADWHDVIFTACLIAVVIVLGLLAGFCLGWFEFSASFKVVPPWRRRAAAPRQAAGAADAAPAPAAIQMPERKAS